MVLLVEAGRVNDVLIANGVRQVEDGDAGSPYICHVRHNVELGDLAALHGHGADTCDTVQRRLQGVRRQFPKFSLRKTICGETITKDGKRREREAVGSDLRRRWQRLLDAADGRIDELK